MKRFAFISRHEPTPGQIALAAAEGIELVAVGDRDAFTIDAAEFAGFEGAVVVHPAAALKLYYAGLGIGIFENAARPAEGGKPAFEAKALHLF